MVKCIKISVGRAVLLFIYLFFCSLISTINIEATTNGLNTDDESTSASANKSKDKNSEDNNTKKSSSSSSTSNSSDAALQLNGKNFRQVVLQEPPKNGMVMFYQEWCANSKRLMPHWDRLARESPPSVYIGKIDCGSKEDGSSQLCHGKEIRNFPLLKYYYSGDEHPYNGARSYDALISFVEDKMALPCKIHEREVTCSGKARGYIEKWINKDVSDIKAELLRLKKLSQKNKSSDESSIKPEIQRWIRQRRRILKQIWEEKPSNYDGHGDEL